MIKSLALLAASALTYSGDALAQISSSNLNVLSVPAAEMPLDGPLDSGFVHSPEAHSPIPFPAGPDSYSYNGYRADRSSARPVVVVPMPLPANGMSRLNGIYGSQFPGSYLPRDTSLHRFNGYVVCDPPDISGNTAAGSVAGAPPRRLVKITSTRPLAAPGHSQPCPVYTINGEFQNQKNGFTATMPSIPSAPPPPVTR